MSAPTPTPAQPGAPGAAVAGAIALHARASVGFDAKLRQSIALLHEAQGRFPRAPGAIAPVVQASSLGAEDMVITHLLHAQGLEAEVFVLETGQLHAETLDLLQRVQADAWRPVQVYRPQPGAAEAFVAREGAQAMYRSIALRKACCGIRKMEPLQRAMAGRSAWITGLRREQSGARAEVPFWDHADPALAKLNPLADWTWGDVWHYIAQHGVPYNALHDRFFPSIGCEPCTRAVSLGEDFRAGRWWWEQDAAKECGLHVAPTPAEAGALPTAPTALHAPPETVTP
jgi:phosphoadenosine phosphosulfate reductase